MRIVLLVAILLTASGVSLFAQTTTPPAEETEKKDQETLKTEPKTEGEIKAVPVAKDKNAKPKKVGARNPASRPSSVGRPARNTRPAVRPVRPGNGRN